MQDLGGSRDRVGGSEPEISNIPGSPVPRRLHSVRLPVKSMENAQEIPKLYSSLEG